MARIAIDITTPQLVKAKTLVDAGVYESLQQFGEVAFANQLALEDGADPEDLAESARKRRRKAPDIPPLPLKRPERVQKKAILKTKANAVAVEHSDGNTVAGFDELLPLLGLDAVTTKAAPTRALVASAEPRVLGLVNKPFGLKLVARLALVQAKTEWPAADVLAGLVNEAAASIGAAVSREDRAAERTRNLLQTGLPTKDTSESNQRFGAQYLGRVARSGQITVGAIVQFSLASMIDGRVVLSDAGAQLARLRNPVFDERVRPWERLLSRQEQEFMVAHVARYVPSEAADTKAVVRAIQGGHDRPEGLLAAMQEMLPSDWSDVQTRSYISGLVTRLTELDVVSRVWTGRHVHYELGPLSPIVINADTREVA